MHVGLLASKRYTRISAGHLIGTNQPEHELYANGMLGVSVLIGGELFQLVVTVFNAPC